MRLAIQAYADEAKIRQGEAVREILLRGLMEQGRWPFKPLDKS